MVELKNFFEEYTKLENKKVEIGGFQTLETAIQVIHDHLDRYKLDFQKL